MKKLTLIDFQNRLENIHPQEKLQAIEWDGGDKLAKVKCLTCGNEYIKKGENFLDKRKVNICKVCFSTHSNQLKETCDLPDGYVYMEPYKGMHNKVLVKHNQCGFIWYITPANLKIGKGCPKCNKKISKGEQKIINWLEEKHIPYQRQVPLDINGHHLSIDFYLPIFDIYIEYNGVQHYEPVNYFGGEDKFIQQQNNDQLKRLYLKNKLIEIPYIYFENIEEILISSTTISKESTRQALAAEVEKLLFKKG